MESNPYPEDFDQASECLRLALALLARHRIAPSPMNYRLAYEYASGQNRQLMAELDSLVAEEEGTAPGTLLGLYERTFQTSGATLEAMRDELRRLIDQTHSRVERSGSGLSEYIEALGRFSELLDKSACPDAMADEVSRVLAGTRDTEKTQRRFGSELAELAAEVEALRKELDQVRQESKTDVLTGISNRRAFEAALEHTLENAREQQQVFCLLICDIDHFKRFNDTYGHLVGDKVLRFVATTLKRAVKGRDLVARYGGEEFAIILPETRLAGARSVAEQIRSAVSAGNLKDKNGDACYGRITVSIGVAQSASDDDAASLIQRADEALYQAKEKGRNRVEKVA